MRNAKLDKYVADYQRFAKVKRFLKASIRRKLEKLIPAADCIK
jgi:hypothetical protein